jgi:L-asparaginase II
VAVLAGMQAKIGVGEADLMCGTHPPSDSATWKAMLLRGEEPGPRRHNCSGKHTGMLGQAILRGLPTTDYYLPSHPVQQKILQTFAEMTGLEPAQVVQGIDGCSVPTFAIPLYHAALGFARLADPRGLASGRAEALGKIFQAMPAHPDMVAGPGGFDTLLMQAGGGQLLCKGGAEGYQAIAIAPGALSPNSRGIGIALKIADGDATGRARAVASLTLLRAAGWFAGGLPQDLERFDRRTQYNYRRLEVGEIRSCFSIERVR